MKLHAPDLSAIRGPQTEKDGFHTVSNPSSTTHLDSGWNATLPVIMLGLLFIAMAMPAFSRTIYVSRSGNDTGAGTSANPYRTVTRANLAAVSGDVIRIGKGHHPDHLVTSKRVTFAIWDGVATVGTGIPSVSAGETQIRPICEGSIGLPLVAQPVSPSANPGGAGGSSGGGTSVAQIASPGYGEVQMQGTVANPDGNARSTWSLVSGPGDFQFRDPSNPQTWGRFNGLGRYVLRLTVQNGPYTVSADVIVDTVVGVCTPTPRPIAGADFTAAGLSATLNGEVVVPSSVDRSRMVIRWLPVSGPGNAAFESPFTERTRVTVSAYGTYVFRLAVSYNALTRTDDIRVIFQRDDVDIVRIDSVPNVVLPNVANIRATATDDGLPRPLTLSWSKASGPGSVGFNPPNAANTVASFSAEGIYVLRLAATDGANTSSNTVQVIVSKEIIEPPVNDPPVVKAGSDQSIDLGDAAFLNGTATDDGLPRNPGRLTITWSKVSGPGGVSFGNASQPNTTASFTVAGDYVLRLSASDGDKLDSDTAQVTVREAKDYLTTENTTVSCGVAGNMLRIRNTHSYRSISYVMTLRLSTVFQGEFDQTLRGVLAPGESREFACSSRSTGPGYGYVLHRITSATFSSAASLMIMAASEGVTGPELTYGISPTEFVLSWPIAAVDAVLEATDEMSPTARWESVSESSFIEEERQIIKLHPDHANRFYRLKMPE